MNYKNDYYYDLDIENYFDFDSAPTMPTTPGFLGTNPQDVSINTSPRMNADGKLKEKLKKFAQSDKGKKLLKIYAGVGIAAVLIAAGPAIISALSPVLPAMKLLLSKKGIKAKGFKEILKKFTETQLSLSAEDKKDPKKIIKGILGFFKAAKDRRAAGTASPLDEEILNVADTTIQKIADGTLPVDDALEIDEPAKNTKQLTTDTATTTTTETKKTGIDFKIVLIVLVAVFFLTKK